MDWKDYDLHTIMDEIHAFMKAENLTIPLIAAGGIFTGSDAVSFLEKGAGGVQVATRFTVTHECGLPDSVKQEYFRASEEDIIVNGVSPTGYPMRMLKQTPAIGSGIRPGCESYGYLLDATGNCAYINSYNREVQANPGQKNIQVFDKTCLCTHMRNFNCWTCGSTTYRLKDTTHKLSDGTYQILSAEHVFKDYQFSVDNQVALPPRQEAAA
jgi:NAD(P)H-dependent flavin oxidoreductase YrpB (nitropropane dioxygenase family)